MFDMPKLEQDQERKYYYTVTTDQHLKSILCLGLKFFNLHMLCPSQGVRVSFILSHKSRHKLLASQLRAGCMPSHAMQATNALHQHSNTSLETTRVMQ